MLEKIYLEITNVCNLDCSFCHKTARPHRRMTNEDFELLTDRLQGEVKYLFFHLMGEPLLHPLLPQFVRRAREKGFLPFQEKILGPMPIENSRIPTPHARATRKCPSSWIITSTPNTSKASNT